MEGFDIKFRQMSDDEFNKYSNWCISDYSRNFIKSGMCSEITSLKCAKREFNKILPQGKNTLNNFMHTIENNENKNIGFIWYGKHSTEEVFLCDLLILEKFRRDGFGKQAMLVLENEVKEKGATRIRLNVFKFNKPAISLYNSLGYIIYKNNPENMYMMKDI